MWDPARLYNPKTREIIRESPRTEATRPKLTPKAGPKRVRVKSHPLPSDESPVAQCATVEAVIYTDGACAKNPGGRGGWAAIVICGNSSREFSGGSMATTNNRMEMLAVIEGIRALEQASRVTVYSDSQYVIKGASTWMKNWKARNWKKADGEVKNVDLWQELDRLVGGHSVTWKWVRGHNGNVLNERCDMLADRAMWRANPWNAKQVSGNVSV